MAVEGLVCNKSALYLQSSAVFLADACAWCRDFVHADLCAGYAGRDLFLLAGQKPGDGQSPGADDGGRSKICLGWTVWDGSGNSADFSCLCETYTGCGGADGESDFCLCGMFFPFVCGGVFDHSYFQASGDRPPAVYGSDHVDSGGESGGAPLCLPSGSGRI